MPKWRVYYRKKVQTPRGGMRFISQTCDVVAWDVDGAKRQARESFGANGIYQVQPIGYAKGR
jgi:pyruvate carboxylase